MQNWKTLTKNLSILIQVCSLYLGKANLQQKICKRGPQSSKIFGQKFQWIYHLGKFALVKTPEETLAFSHVLKFTECDRNLYSYGYTRYNTKYIDTNDRKKSARILKNFYQRLGDFAIS